MLLAAVYVAPIYSLLLLIVKLFVSGDIPLRPDKPTTELVLKLDPVVHEDPEPESKTRPPIKKGATQPLSGPIGLCIPLEWP